MSEQMNDIGLEAHYPGIQFSYVKGELNVTARGEDVDITFKRFADAVMKAKTSQVLTDTVAAQKDSPNKNEEAVKPCPKCNSEVVFRSGTSKAGKQYAGNFCTNSSCDYKEWK